MKEIIEKLVSENTLNFGKCKTLEDYAELEDNFTKKLLKAINYTRCCETFTPTEILKVLDDCNSVNDAKQYYLDENI